MFDFEKKAMITYYTEQNMQLRKQLQELTDLLEAKEKESNQHLGSVEYRVEQLEAVNANLTTFYEAKLLAKSQECDQLLGDIQQLQTTIDQNTATLQQTVDKAEQLETYLNKLPTVEEHQNALNQVRTLQKRAAHLENQLSNRQKQFEDQQRALNEVLLKFQTSERREQLLQTQLDGAMQRLDLKSNPHKTHTTSKVTPEFIEDVQFERNRYHALYEQTKKLLEAETHRAEAAEARQKMEQRLYREHLAREEATTTGLKTSLETRLKEHERLKETIAELNLEKQDLMSKMLEARAGLSKAIGMWRSCDGKLRLRLLRDLGETVREAHSLAEHLNRLACGDKLDISNLLSSPPTQWTSCECTEVDGAVEDEAGFTSDVLTIPEVDLEFADNLTELDLNSLVQTVHDARETLTCLRQRLTDRYAEHLGGKIDCSVQ